MERGESAWEKLGGGYVGGVTWGVSKETVLVSEVIRVEFGVTLPLLLCSSSFLSCSSIDWVEFVVT
jgi:hypothetical protein